MALFLVMASLALLTFLVTEFSYVSTVHSRLSYDYVDSLKAHYAAQTGLKFSLLRLKAFREMTMLAKGEAGSAIPGLSPQVLNSIWQVPFRFPLPPNLPGMTLALKDQISKFQKESATDASWTAVISAETNKINLNLLVEGFNPTAEKNLKKKKSTDGNGDDANQDGVNAATPSTAAQDSKEKPPTFSTEESRKSIRTQIQQIFEQKSNEDPYYANKLKTIDTDELIDNLTTWVDPFYSGQNRSGKQLIPYKRAPFYHISELRQIHPIDDEIFDLLTQVFTVGPKSAVNINTMQKALIQLLFPELKPDDVDEFLKYRDGPEEPHPFKDEEALWEYLGKISGSFQGESLKEAKKSLVQRGISLTTLDSRFNIQITGTSRGASRRLEAFVILDDPTPPSKNAGQNPNSSNANNPSNSGIAAAENLNNTNLNNSSYPPLENVPGMRIWFIREW